MDGARATDRYRTVSACEERVPGLPSGVRKGDCTRDRRDGGQRICSERAGRRLYPLGIEKTAVVRSHTRGGRECHVSVVDGLSAMRLLFQWWTPTVISSPVAAPPRACMRTLVPRVRPRQGEGSRCWAQKLRE